MLKSSLTIAFVFAATAAAASPELPFAQEYPVIFATSQDPGMQAPTRGKKERAGKKRGAAEPSPDISALISRHATANGVPAELAHRIIARESRYNASARNRTYFGLMQISHATARSVGYRGAAHGLLDPDTNLRYGMTYLGNAYRVAGRDQRRAMKLYSSGFYYEAKRKGMLGDIRQASDAPLIATR